MLVSPTILAHDTRDRDYHRANREDRMNTSKMYRPGGGERSVRILRLALSTLFAAMLVVPGAHGAEWSLGPQVKAGGRYEDNPRLEEDGSGNSITGGYVDLLAVAERRTETSSFQIRPRLYFDRYDESDEDSSDQFLDVFASRRGQRNRLSLRGNLSNQQVLQGEDDSVEFSDSDLDDPDQSASGRFNRRRDRLRWRVKPEYAYEITQRTSLGASAEYEDVDYNNELPGEAIDYWQATGQVFVERILSEKSRIRLTGFASKYDSSDVDNDSKSFGGSLGYQSEISETLDWYAAGGAQRTKVEAGPSNLIDENQTTYIFEAGMNRQWERTRLQTAISRSVDPSGTGFLKTRDGVRVNLRHQLRPRWTGELGAYVFREDAVDDVVDVNKRDYASALARLSWEMSREWSIQGTYTYTYQDYDDEPGDADSNAVAIGIVYRPLRKTWSR